MDHLGIWTLSTTVNWADLFSVRLQITILFPVDVRWMGKDGARERGKGEAKRSRGLSVALSAMEEHWQAQLSWAIITFGRLTWGGTQNSGERSGTRCGGICHFFWVMCHWLPHSCMRCIGLWVGKAVCFYEYTRKHSSTAACSRGSTAYRSAPRAYL